MHKFFNRYKTCNSQNQSCVFNTTNGLFTLFASPQFVTNSYLIWIFQGLGADLGDLHFGRKCIIFVVQKRRPSPSGVDLLFKYLIIKGYFWGCF